MRLTEFQSKSLFRHSGLPVPDGETVETPEAAARVAERLGGRVAVKAQIPIGGRGKAGGIRLAGSPAEAQDAARALLGSRVRDFVVRQVLVEQAVSIAAEYYLGVTVDRAAGQAVFIFSTSGGMDIEEVAERAPERIAKRWVDPSLGLRDFQLRQLFEDGNAPVALRRELSRFAGALYELFRRHDAQLVEVNPLVARPDHALMALDGKVEIDDNALFRHPELSAYRAQTADHPLEEAAREQGLAYVKLHGEVGIIGNGAGLVMATLDMVQREGGHPANFLDIGGGARADVVEKALGVVMQDGDVRSILLNVFGGITRCDEVARGLLQAVASVGGARVPIVVRLAGTREEEGRALLQGSSIETAPAFQEAARRAVALAAQAR